MAIYGAVPPPSNLDPATTTQTPDQQTTTSPVIAEQPDSTLPETPKAHQSTSRFADIEAWTVSALQSLSISPIARGTGSPLTIPLDEAARQRQLSRSPRQVRTDADAADANADAGADPNTSPQAPAQVQRTVTITVDPRSDPIRRPLSRRDSQKKRDALLKGNEGSRQRRRWENDRLMHVPNVQPPLPSDFEARPTHPVHHVPYQLAAFWDREPSSLSSANKGDGRTLRQRYDEKTAAQQARRKKHQLTNGSATGLGAGMVPRDLREYAKRSPAVRQWLQYLEEPVRGFARRQREAQIVEQDDTDVEGLDSEDEEIVFVGRKNQPAAKGHGWKNAKREIGGAGGSTESGVVFDDLGDDNTATFKRWLIHCLSTYYGLDSRSVTAGSPPHRVVYVGAGIEPTAPKSQKRLGHISPRDMPKPLWEVC